VWLVCRKGEGKVGLLLRSRDHGRRAGREPSPCSPLSATWGPGGKEINRTITITRGVQSHAAPLDRVALECAGKERGRWSCYFSSRDLGGVSGRELSRCLAATPPENRTDPGAVSRLGERPAWHNPCPEKWGKPWERIQASVDVAGESSGRPASEPSLVQGQALQYDEVSLTSFVCGSRVP